MGIRKTDASSFLPSFLPAPLGGVPNARCETAAARSLAEAAAAAGPPRLVKMGLS